jgi:hypothetical protein
MTGEPTSEPQRNQYGFKKKRVAFPVKKADDTTDIDGKLRNSLVL